MARGKQSSGCHCLFRRIVPTRPILRKNENLSSIITLAPQPVPSTILRMDHHTVAAISITGTCLDVLGSLYLAYDLLGGQHGPLRLLTRAVTYSIIFGIGYGLGLGLFFGVVSGIATGLTISIEMNRAARGLEHYSLAWEAVFSAIRGLAFGAGLYRVVGFPFAVCLCHPYHSRSDLCLFQGHASRHGVCCVAAPEVDASAILGHRESDIRLHSHRASL